ncbi:hypothetical protein ACLIYP_19450 [Streptomyces nanhaiensis]|uniref:hypothetical protein n=1 Tax=Streptomyces nanhaiensis TaxID=679319 RepID=UPI00399CAE1D
MNFTVDSSSPVRGARVAGGEVHRGGPEAAILRRLLGLLAYAANPRNIALSDRPELVRDIALLVAELTRAPGRPPRLPSHNGRGGRAHGAL